MSNASPQETGNAPIEDFSRCHIGIVTRLDRLAELPALLAGAARARDVAESSLEFFREAIFEHHQDEEKELFPAVLAHAAKGAEHDHAKALVKRLTDEHRELEALWKTLESGLKKAAQGKASDLDGADVERLVTQYRAHAQFEEAEFLPLSQQILGRNANTLAALGLSLHMRHVRPDDLPAHV